jgi:hypothetical protein
MAVSVTLATMRTLARQRAAMESLDPTNAFVSDTEIASNLNYHLNFLYRRLVAAREAGYFRKATPATITTVADVASYALPADFYQLISVDWQRAPGNFVSVYAITEAERNIWRRTPGRIWDGRASYQLQNQNIVFFPTPQADSTFLLNYVPSFVPLVADADAFDGVAGFEDYAIWKTAAWMHQKDQDESGAQYAELQAQSILQEVTDLMQARDNASPARVQDVTLTRSDWSGY